MKDNASHNAEIHSLAESVCAGSITPERCERLSYLLRSDEDAALTYAIYVRMHGLLCWHWQDQVAVINTSEAAPPHVDLAEAGFLGGIGRGAVGFFSQTVPFSYLTAMLVVGAMLLGAWAYKISLHENNHFVEQSPPTGQSYPQHVGRVTGMKDCVWSDKQSSTILGAYVLFDRKYVLSSGLLEITYTSGARVILEGPCEYTVDSQSGGYLAVGKLTARVEKKVAIHQPPATNPAPSPQPPASSLSTLHSSLFTISTPTAIVTDLGTEFGVEVNEQGDTTSYVFRGSVKVKAIDGDGKQETILRENESARIARDNTAGKSYLITGDDSDTPPKFVRRIIDLPKLLDLLDIVAGGNGLTRLRERGIDPYSGLEDPMFVTYQREGNQGFRPVEWHRLIDGVFIPDGKSGPVKVDSAGHAFELPATDGKGWGCLWARAAETDPALADRGWIYKIERPERFTPDGRGLLAFHANAGITFNLDAARKSISETRPARFRAVAGLADVHARELAADKKVDIWVLVDGQLKQKQAGLCRRDGTVKLDVKLDAADRFLTLIVTDGGDGQNFDSLVIGDPVLEMKPIEKEP